MKFRLYIYISAVVVYLLSCFLFSVLTGMFSVCKTILLWGTDILTEPNSVLVNLAGRIKQFINRLFETPLYAALIIFPVHLFAWTVFFPDFWGTIANSTLASKLKYFWSVVRAVSLLAFFFLSTYALYKDPGMLGVDYFLFVSASLVALFHREIILLVNDAE